MAQRFLITLTIVSGLAACNWGKSKDDVLSGGKTTVVYATTQCTVPNADGVRCDKKTCKKDARSDCAVFSDRCTQSGHTYEGGDDSGTCVRGDQVG